MRFEDVFSRIDEHSIREILGSNVIKLLSLLYKNELNNSFLRKLIIQQIGAEELITNYTYRDMIINLLRVPEAELLCELMNIDSNNPYKSLKKLKFKKGTEKELTFFRFFNLIPINKEESDAYIPSNLIQVNSNYALFPHQRRAARTTIKMLNEYPHRVLLHMPTGSGKTRTAMNIIADHFRKYEGTTIVWLAASEELCEQAAEEFEKAWSFLGDRSINLIRYWGEYQLPNLNYQDCFMVAGLAKLVSKSKNYNGIDFISKLASRSSLIIIDEAHQAIAPTYQSILDTLFYIGRENRLLGLSATPGRSWNNIDLDAKLANYFSKRKVKLEIDNYENPVDYLTDKGYLAKVHYKQLIYNEGNLTHEDINSITEFKDLPLHLLKKIGEDEHRNLKIIIEIEQLAKKHNRIIIFAPSVDSANMLALILNARGYNANSVTGITNPHVRKRIINDYKDDSNKVKILCNYGVLTTGFDAPLTSAAVIARPTMSLVLYSQMVGRAIRGERAGGNPEAEIVTVIDQQLPGFSSVAESFNNWEDVWT